MRTILTLAFTAVMIFGVHNLLSDTESKVLMHPIFALDLEISVLGVSLICALVFRMFSVLLMPIFSTCVVMLVVLEGDVDKMKSYPSDRMSYYHQAGAEQSFMNQHFEQANYHFKQQAVVNVGSLDLKEFANPKAARRAMGNVGVMRGYARFVSEGFKFKKYKSKVSTGAIVGAVDGAKNDCDAAVVLLGDEIGMIDCSAAYKHFKTLFYAAKARSQARKEQAAEKNK